MAIPAALFIRKFSYKSGIILGLVLYALGAMLSIPAANNANFNLFILALYILTFGLAFLETTANPYILSMGDPRTSTQRLNLAQAFNPIGSLTGMFIASTIILSNIEVEDVKNDVATNYYAKYPQAEKKAELNVLPFLKATPRKLKHDTNAAAYVAALPLEDFPTEEKAFNKALDKAASEAVGKSLEDYKAGVIPSYQGKTHLEMQKSDLKIVSTPYMIIGFIVLGVMVLFFIIKMPKTTLDNPEDDKDLDILATLKRLGSNPKYIGGVIAQMFYVGAQIMVWTFIIHYAERELGMDKATAQNHNILAMGLFLLSRFICTAFLKYVKPSFLLTLLAIGGIICTLGTIHLTGMAGL